MIENQLLDGVVSLYSRLQNSYFAELDNLYDTKDFDPYISKPSLFMSGDIHFTYLTRVQFEEFLQKNQFNKGDIVYSNTECYKALFSIPLAFGEEGKLWTWHYDSVPHYSWNEYMDIDFTPNGDFNIFIIGIPDIITLWKLAW